MSPDSDFNVNRVEGLGQIASSKQAGPREKRRQRQNTAKKQSNRDPQKPVEDDERTVQGEDVDEVTDDGHSIDYQA